MKKIAIVTRELITGGVEKSLINILKEIDTDSNDITLYLMRCGGILEKELPNSIKIKDIFLGKTSSREIIKEKFKKLKFFEAIKISFYFARAFIELKKNNYFEYYYFISKIVEKPKEEYDLVI